MRALRAELEDLVSHPKTVKVTTEFAQNAASAQPVIPTTSAPSGPFPFATNLLPRMFGAIAMASGGLRFINKPAYADIYAGRGAGTLRGRRHQRRRTQGHGQRYRGAKLRLGCPGGAELGLLGYPIVAGQHDQRRHRTLRHRLTRRRVGSARVSNG
ncbi:Uncharacterised protein [Mycobacteroides abscessus subsp. abscessus]|nr:Uncharacterised protein [Mycobacteroides abscessus subsp. abscessus]